MALLDTGTQVPPYLFPWPEETLNSTDGVWCFSVGKGSQGNLVRRTFGIIQCAVIVASTSDYIIRIDMFHVCTS